MKIFTSYFAKAKELDKKGIFCIGIAVKAPFWFGGITYNALCPPGKLVSDIRKGIIDRKKYDIIYNKQLDKLNPEKLLKDLERLSGGMDIALLCYEKDLEDCHRWNVMKWLNNSGFDVKECEFEPTKAETAKKKREVAEKQQGNLF